MYIVVVSGMREVANTPRMARNILPLAVINQGHEQVNAVLSFNKMPLRFTRIESWEAEERRNRKLAFVRWPAVRSHRPKQLRLPLQGGSDGHQS